MNERSDHSAPCMLLRLTVVWSLVLGGLLYLLNLLFVPFLLQFPLPLSLIAPGYASALSVFVQYSKQNVEPTDYVAIFGDSYAQGLGDWFYRVQQQVRPDYQTTHVLFHQTGRDVVTFGYMGSSSISGYVLLPLEKFISASAMTGFNLQKPVEILLYFYEGNDMDDNQLEMIRYEQEGGSGADLLQLPGFDRYISQQTVKIREEVATTQEGWYAQWLSCRFLTDAIAHAVSVILHGKNDPAVIEATPIGTINAVMLESGLVQVPDKLVGPALSLDEAKLSESLAILDHSLRYTRRLFPEARMTMVYIPAPASIYRFSGDVSTQDGTFPAALIRDKSRRLRERVARVAGHHKIPMLDVTPALQESSRKVLVHGPVDWYHFNEAGYRVLANELTSWLARSPLPPAAR